VNSSAWKSDKRNDHAVVRGFEKRRERVVRIIRKSLARAKFPYRGQSNGAPRAISFPNPTNNKGVETGTNNETVTPDPKRTGDGAKARMTLLADQSAGARKGPYVKSPGLF
jgi:hypothetical protein